MSQEPADTFLSPLPCAAIVYRAIRPSWVKEDGGLLTVAFMLRPKATGADAQGLSVTTSTVDDCMKALKNCKQVVSLHVGKVRDVNLDIISDDKTHANIVGLPYSEHDPARAERLAGLLVKQSRLQWSR